MPISSSGLLVLRPTLRKYDLKGAEGPLSVTRKEYKAFITKKDINKIADFYEDGVFKGNQKTQTYVGTLLHMMLGNGNGFFPWTTQDQHMMTVSIAWLSI